MDNTFITLHRKLLTSACFADAELLKVWLWCLLRANYKDTEVVHDGRIISLKRGQFITGRFKACEELRMGASKFRKRMDILGGLRQISVKTTNKYSIITVIKYSDYQDKDNKTTNRKPTESQQKATDNNVNKEQQLGGEPQKDMGWKNNQGDEPDIPDVDLDSGEIIKPKEKPKRHYREVYELFKTLGTIPLNWNMNTTQQTAAENLYTERGLEQIQIALQFYKEHKGEEYLPEITSPYELDSKWKKLHNYKKKHG